MSRGTTPLRISTALMFKLLASITVAASLCAQVAWSQSADTRVTPQRSCPAAQPYCNNEWEAVGANGERYWMVRWARSAPSDIVTLRFPLQLVHPIGQINCSGFGKNFPQPSCQQPFAISLLLEAKYSDFEAFLKLGEISSQDPDDPFTISINSSAAGLLKRNPDEIFMGFIDSFSRIGQRIQYPREYRGTKFNLNEIGPRDNIYGNEALGLTDLYYDGSDIFRSNNVISCTYNKSPVKKRRCTQAFAVKEFNSIAKVTYGIEHLPQWEKINHHVNEAIKSAVQER